MADALERALRDLGDALDTGTPAPGLAAAVLDRVAAEPLPDAATRLRTRLRRLLAGLLVALGLTGAVVSPVGADVVDWFHGVLVTEAAEDAEVPAGEPDVPPADGGLGLDAAEVRVGYRPYLPAALGRPDGVAVDTGRGLVSMSWERDGATIRLDQFDAGISPTFWKTARGAYPVRVGASEGLWFPVPHEVVLLGDTGEVAVPARLAARTLIWPLADRTLRLEGDLTLDRAIEIAASAR